ncbi:hypothetical protein KUTeg_001337, partial [Tegillarca granosa]
CTTIAVNKKPCKKQANSNGTSDILTSLNLRNITSTYVFYDSYGLLLKQVTTDVKISKTTYRDETKLIRIKLANELFIIDYKSEFTAFWARMNTYAENAIIILHGQLTKRHARFIKNGFSVTGVAESDLEPDTTTELGITIVDLPNCPDLARSLNIEIQTPNWPNSRISCIHLSSSAITESTSDNLIENEGFPNLMDRLVYYNLRNVMSYTVPYNTEKNSYRKSLKMPPSSGELWGHHLMPSQVQVDCLLPNGILIQLCVNRDETLERIKSDLWYEARKFPLFNLLLDPASYIFVSITQDAEREEFYDETKRLCDLRLFQPILKVVEPIGNREEKMLNYEIGLTISIPVNEFNEMKDLEVVTFRRNILEVCKEAVNERELKGASSLAMYAYPPDVESNDFVVVCIWVVSDDGSRNKFSVKILHSSCPSDVIAETIRRRSRIMGITKEHAERCIEEYGHTYALKVCGCDQFLLQECPISQYKYVRECIARDKIPQLMLLTKEGIYNSLPENKFTVPAYSQRGIQAIADINNQQTISLWEIHAMLRIRIHVATRVNVKELGKIYVKAGIYHGTEALCESQVTKEVESNNPRWNEWLEFLYIPDIPRSARLCISLCSVFKRKNKKVHYALAWGNLQMFDYNDRLLNEKVSLNLWPMPQGMDELLNPIGIPGSNPDEDTPCLQIEFDKFSYPVSYPPDEHFEEMAYFVMAKEKRNQTVVDTPSQMKEEEEEILKIIARDPLSEFSEQDKLLLWKRRDFCMRHPHSLPKLLQAVKWNDRENVALLYLLLKCWPLVEPEVALELLDCSFPDSKVRSFAVEFLVDFIDMIDI